MAKRSRQLELRMPDKNGQWRGGKRVAGKGKRLGRPPKGKRSSERHKLREAFKASEPVHVTCRVLAEVGSLRRRHMYKAIRAAMLCVVEREPFRIAHVSIQGTHVHLLVEAQERMALARGMQALLISAARHINGAISRRTKTRRRGQVFGDRYHARVIRTPRQARHALAYVLNNWRRHREDGGRYSELAPIDLFSSALAFRGWNEPDVLQVVDPPAGLEPLPIHASRTWLLSTGWKRHGLIRADEVPGAMPS